MQRDDATLRNQPLLCNAARSAQLPGIPPCSYANHISTKKEEAQEMNARYPDLSAYQKNLSSVMGLLVVCVCVYC